MNTIKARLILGLLVIAGSAYAQPAKYELTITNGSKMPLSPALVYSKDGTEAAAAIGSIPTAGFVQLCQTGQGQTRLNELRSNKSISFVAQSTGPIMPGETRMLEVEVNNPQTQSLHIETMYGKTKDVCGVGTFSSHNLFALQQHVTTQILVKDNTVLTDTFIDPALPRGKNYLDSNFCSSATNAVSCLRELAAPNTNGAKIRFFSGYIPSVIMALETKYGSEDVQTLLFPTSGAIELKLKLKH